MKGGSSSKSADPKTACVGNGGNYSFAATMKFKRQRFVSEGALARMLEEATGFWRRREFGQWIKVLERACSLDPANANLLLDLGHAYGLRYDYAAAERCFEKAVRVAPRKAEVLAAAGLKCRDFAGHEMAERYLQRALEQSDAAPEAFVNLAELYERLHRQADAARLVDRALQLNATCPAALLARARQERQAGRLDEAERLIRSFLPNAETSLRVRSWYELGAILDRQRRYDEAMAAFLEAKALLRPDAAQPLADLQIVRSRLNEMKANISADGFQRWLDSGKAFQPPRRLALLCGHPRSGTTLLEQVLDAHPDIVSAEETTIFHDDAYVPLTRGLPDGALMLTILESAQNDVLQRSRENYFRFMELTLGKPVGSRMLIDKNPSYTFLIPAYVRVFPEMKFLVALRDPRDVCLSCFMQHLPVNQVGSAYLSLEGTVEEYASLMGTWTRIKPLMRSPYLEVRYEDMLDDLESVARRALDFLGVSWDTRVLRFDEHARGKMVRSPTYADVAKPVFKTAVGRWRNYQKYLEPYLDKLAPFASAFGYQ